MVHTQIFKAFIDHPLNMLLPRDSFFHILLRPRQELRCHHNVFPPCIVPQRPSQILLAGAALVADGRIKKIDAQFQPPLYDFTGVLLVNGP